MFDNKKLLKLRKAKGLTQEELADILCISQSSYARLENGTSKNGIFYVEKLCQTFLVSPLDLLLIKQDFSQIKSLKKEVSDKDQIINYLQNRVHNLENTLKLFQELSNNSNH